MCEVCQRKKKIPQKGLVVKPILSAEFNARAQADLIDLQAQNDGDYKFVLVYQVMSCYREEPCISYKTQL